MEQLRSTVRALDPITVAGLAKCLEALPGTSVVRDKVDVDVVVAMFGQLSDNAVALLRAEIGKPIVLLVNEINEIELLTAVECRVTSILPPAAAIDGRLATAIREAVDRPLIPLAELADQAKRLSREMLATHGQTTPSWSARELDVARLMASGKDTHEIAVLLRYSERTIKNIIHGLTNRLHLRNRAHVVACALRAGVI